MYVAVSKNLVLALCLQHRRTIDGRAGEINFDPVHSPTKHDHRALAALSY